MQSIKAFTLIFSVLTALFANAVAEEIQEPWWRLDTEDRWCFYLPEKQACLPATFVVTEFEAGHAQWKYWKENGPSYLIRYKIGSPMDTGDTLLNGDAFLIKSSFGNHSVQVTEWSANLSKKGAHKLSVFVVEFDGTFSLTLLGTDTEGLRTLAHSLSEQWSVASE